MSPNKKRRQRRAPVRAGDLAPNPRNPRTIDDGALERLGASMRKYGDLSGFVFNRRTGRLVGGHQRLKHLPADAPITLTERRRRPNAQGTVAVGHVELDGERWPYRVVDVDEAREAEMNVAANAHGGEWDREALAAALERIRDEDLATAGFAPGTLKSMFPRGRRREPDVAERIRRAEQQKIDRPKRPTSRLGNVYELGAHRLLCGDATDAAAVAELFAGERAQLVYTDPPYGVDYVSQLGRAVRNDDKEFPALVKLLAGAFKLAAAHSANDAAFYVWHASATRPAFEAALAAAGLYEREYLLWIKPSSALGWADYQWAHEPCFYAAKREGREPPFHGDRSASTVWRCGVQTADGPIAALGSGVLVCDLAGRAVWLAPAPPGRRAKVQRLVLGDGERATFTAPDDIASAWEVARERGAVHPTQKPIELARRAIANSSRVGDIVYDAFGGSGNTLLAAELLGRRALLVELDRAWCDVVRARYERLVQDGA